jgi:hypothetical protein
MAKTAADQIAEMMIDAGIKSCPSKSLFSTTQLWEWFDWK